MKNWTFALALGAMICVGGGAYAQAQPNMLAQHGDWAAFSHTPTPVSAPDVCFAISDTPTAVVLRVDNKGDIDFRLGNNSWSLPANVKGVIKVDVNKHIYTYQISGNQVSMVNASITQDQLTALAGDMEAASSMQVQAGSATPVNIPLDGSNLALTAFLTCADIPNPSKNTGGSNPFASSSSSN